MWRHYSKDYIRHNKASGISIMTAAFITALLLSLVCSLFYNIWKYDVDKIIYKEGNWHGKILCEEGVINQSEIEHFASVLSVTHYLEEGQEVFEISFLEKRDTYKELPKIAKTLGLTQEELSYNELLLSQYLIWNPNGELPPLLLPFYLLILGLVSISLILIIRNAFASSMAARIHQLGILSTIGATPRQIKTCLMQEALILCAGPLVGGTLGGMIISLFLVHVMNRMGEGVEGRLEAEFSYHPLLFLFTVLVCFLTVFLSAWLPARKMSKLTPLQAIYPLEETGIKKKKFFSKLACCLGVEGELAYLSLQARKRAIRTSFLSLTFSFVAFTMFLSFMTLSRISTKYTYFQRYQEAWDIMINDKEGNITDVSKLEEIKQIEGVESCTAYQKARAYTLIGKDEISRELQELSVSAVAGEAIKDRGDNWQIEVPIMVLDEDSFSQYCRQIGAKEKNSSILINRIFDSINSNFRNPSYIPLLKESKENVSLVDETGKEILGECNVWMEAEKLPVLREEYDNYALVLIMPVSLYKSMESLKEETESEIDIRILAQEESRIDEIEEQVRLLFKEREKVLVENRTKEVETSDNAWKGYMAIVGGGCIILALIGIANVFADTLGFLYQRKREFARYLSVGLTPSGMKKILWIEACMIVGRPILITIPLTGVFIVFAVKASYLQMGEFLRVAPVMPTIGFVFFLFLSVGIAYYIGGKQLLKSDLSGVLRDDSMV